MLTLHHLVPLLKLQWFILCSRFPASKYDIFYSIPELQSESGEEENEEIGMQTKQLKSTSHKRSWLDDMIESEPHSPELFWDTESKPQNALPQPKSLFDCPVNPRILNDADSRRSVFSSPSSSQMIPLLLRPSLPSSDYLVQSVPSIKFQQSFLASTRISCVALCFCSSFPKASLRLKNQVRNCTVCAAGTADGCVVVASSGAVTKRNMV
ncbi:hypothetical protein Fmac_020704 [Flemingia macrophylla]|uniref:Uncharacterized protein n=1 Tax=Flemingia macrophylla TaxID=520843 RepID=A0ABD1LUS0_9FABA